MTSAMRRGWQLTGAVMLLICIVTGFEARDLSLFDRLGPGPGFFPFWLCLIGAVLCAVVLVQVTLMRPEPDSGDTIFPRGGLAVRTAAIMVVAGVCTALLDPLGFRISVTLFSWALLPVLGERRWWAVGIFGLVAGFGLFHVFNNWLDVLLPVGALGI